MSFSNPLTIYVDYENTVYAEKSSWWGLKNKSYELKYTKDGWYIRQITPDRGEWDIYLVEGEQYPDQDYSDRYSPIELHCLENYKKAPLMSEAFLFLQDI